MTTKHNKILLGVDNKKLKPLIKWSGGKSNEIKTF